jgi:1-acyl-sn-glycerol-3-phosphate acyltransferase
MNLKKPLWLAYKGYVFMVFFVTLVPFYPIFRYLLAKESRWKRSFKWQVRWGKVVRFCSGIKLVVSGQDLLPKPPYVIVANHASYIDIFLMYGIVPDFFSFMGMAELSKLPMFGWFFKSGQNIAVDRASRTDSVKAFRVAEQKLEAGYSIALFPEGGIKPQVPELASFKNGAFKLAINTGVAIVPMALFDTHIILESNNLCQTIGRPGKARVKILNPIKTSHLKQEDVGWLREQVWEQLNSELQNYYTK